jgi:hypothetical protein
MYLKLHQKQLAGKTEGRLISEKVKALLAK